MFESLVFVMSLSGCLISIFWHIIHRLYFLQFKAKWLRNMILMAIPFFLLPVPLLRNFVSKPLMDAGIMPTPLVKEIEGVLDKTYIALSQGNVASLSSWEQLLLLVMGLAPIISCAFIIHQAHIYLKLCVAIKHNVRLPLSQQERKQLEKTKDKMQIHREIGLIKSSMATTPFTMGIIHPVIVIPADLPASKDTLCMVFSHELAHIKHKDALFTLISCIILAMHWYNPFCIIYLRALKEANELYSDETVMEIFPNIDRLSYCHLLINLANREEPTKSMFTLNFNGGRAKRQLQRRLDNIIKDKKRHFRMAIALSCIMLNVGLGSTLLYSDVEEVEILNNKNTVTSEKELRFNCTDFQTENDYTASIENTDTIPYGKFFIDKEGNLLPCNNTKATALCKHSYVDGIVTNHKQIGNGCQLDYSYAKRCTTCNKTVIFDFYKTSTWPTCPH